MNIATEKRDTLGKVIFFLALSLLYAAPSYAYAQGCPNPGEVPITAATRPLATKAGIPSTSNCWKPSDPDIGINAAEAKRYLASIMRGGRCGPYQSTVEQLDSKFATCAARFLKDVRALDSRAHIVSAYRSFAHQQYLCGGGCGRVIGPCARAGESKHQHGIAIDISTGTYILPRWIQAMARGYGITFPVRGDSGHMEPAGGANCADPNFRPVDTVGNLAPSSGLTNQLRNLFNPPQQPQVQNPQQRPPQQPQPAPTLPTSQTLSSAFSPTTPEQVSPRAVTPAPPTSSSDAKKEGKKPTAVEQISEWVLGAIETESVATGTDAFFELVSSDGSVTTLEDGSQPITGATSTSPVSGGIYAEQTFTSPDLSGFALEQETKRSYYQGLLQSMKETLVRILAYLKPFGRPVPEDGELHYE